MLSLCVPCDDFFVYICKCTCLYVHTWTHVCRSQSQCWVSSILTQGPLELGASQQPQGSSCLCLPSTGHREQFTDWAIVRLVFSLHMEAHNHLYLRFQEIMLSDFCGHGVHMVYRCIKYSTHKKVLNKIINKHKVKQLKVTLSYIPRSRPPLGCMRPCLRKRHENIKEMSS